MLKLGGNRVVFGDHGPVVGQQPDLCFSKIDHGFDGEGHTGF